MCHRTLTGVSGVALLGLCIAAAVSLPARADDQAPAAPAPAAPAAPTTWWGSFTWSGYAEGGITGNFDSPKNGLDYGQLYTDRANTPVLDQLSIIATRPTDPKATDYDFGFTFQPMYGTDARYTHFFNEFDRSINSRYQFDIVEADILAHLPWVTDGGVDAKIGQYPTPIGYEVILPSGNPLYSHSYIYNFGIPIKHTGVVTTTHVTPMLDIWLGADTGNLTSFGMGDNNEAVAGLGGFGLNLLEGNLTVLALTHIGPENADRPPGLLPDVNGTNRYFNDIVLTYKASDALSFTTELDYVRDDINSSGFHTPEAYGIAQYVSYTVNDIFTLQARGEVFRDTQGFFVAAFPGNLDFTDTGRGLPNTSFGVGKATYEEITLGVNITPPGIPDMFKGAKLRPEIRYDHADQAHPFNSLTSDHQVTLAADVILPF